MINVFYKKETELMIDCVIINYCIKIEKKKYLMLYL